MGLQSLLVNIADLPHALFDNLFINLTEKLVQYYQLTYTHQTIVFLDVWCNVQSNHLLLLFLIIFMDLIIILLGRHYQSCQHYYRFWIDCIFAFLKYEIECLWNKLQKFWRFLQIRNRLSVRIKWHKLLKLFVYCICNSFIKDVHVRSILFLDFSLTRSLI